MKAKATIKRVVKPNGDCFFYLYANDLFVSAHTFLPNEVPESRWSEQSQYRNVMSLAKAIETGNGNDSEEIIYQTPETDK